MIVEELPQPSLERAGVDSEKWQQESGVNYITDVAIVVGQHAPNTLTIKGRTYNYVTGTGDLNKGVGGDYLWLFTTTDPYNADMEGYYLITGDDEEEFSCRTLYKKANFSALLSLNNPRTVDGHYVVECVVQMYNERGEHLGKADLEKGRGSDSPYIRMIMCYAK